MKPVQDLLNRIRWDEQFAQGEFVIGYYDRVERRILKVPFNDITFEAEDHFSVGICDENGEYHHVPLHRIKEIYKDGELIWQRPH